MAAHGTGERQTFRLALVLGGFTCAVAWACTPRELDWLRVVWLVGLVTALMFGAASTWRRQRFTLYGRAGGRTEYAGLAARLWAFVLALCGSAVAFGAVIHWLIERPTERQLGLEWLLSCSPLCLGIVLIAFGADQELGARKRRTRVATIMVFLIVLSPLVLLTGFFSFLGAYAFVTGTRLAW